MKLLQFEDLGLMRYKPCWDYQEEIFKTIIRRKIDRRDAADVEDLASLTLPTSRLLFVEQLAKMGTPSILDKVIIKATLERFLARCEFVKN